MVSARGADRPPKDLRREEVRAMLFLPREEGQGLVEYALILVLVAIVVIAILLLVGPAVGNVFSVIVNAI
jgi:pilus assembly protein Flp/PilA